MKKVNPKIIVLVGVVFVSFSSILIRKSISPSLIIAFYRMFFTWLFIVPSILLNKRSELKNIDKKTLILSIVSGVFLGFHFATWISSIKYTSIASSAILVNTHPIMIVIGSYIVLKERISRKELLSIFITFIGSIIISWGGFSIGQNAVYGNTLAILGAVFVACYMMIGRVSRQKISSATYTFIVYLSCSITLLLLTYYSKIPLYPYSLKEFLIFLGLAVFCTMFGHSIFNWSLKYLKPSFVSISILGEPVLATLWAIIFFSEVPSIWTVFGGITVILGIFLYYK